MAAAVRREQVAAAQAGLQVVAEAAHILLARGQRHKLPLCVRKGHQDNICALPAALEAALHKTVDLFEGLVILTERAFGRVFFPQLTPDERHVCADAALSSGVRAVCTAGAAGLFAGQEHLVGTVKQGNIIVPRLLFRKAQRKGKVPLHAVTPARLSQALGQLRRTAVHRLLRASAQNVDDELIAAHAADDIPRKKDIPQRARRLAQKSVADEMAVAVVHLFEMVDIQNQKHPAAVFQQRFIHMRFRRTAVVQPGEPVVLRQHAQTGIFVLQHVKLLVHQHPPFHMRPAAAGHFFRERSRIFRVSRTAEGAPSPLILLL